MASLPSLSGAASCVEAEMLTSIRKEIGVETGLSCCRAGAPGVWSKDTILFLKKGTDEPLYIVKAGTGEAVDSLLRNEADWLQTLKKQARIADCIPRIIAYRSGANLSFIVETPIEGKLDWTFGEPHIALLRKIQEHSRQSKPFEESRLYRNLSSRLKDLDGKLSSAWSSRLKRSMQKIERRLSGAPVMLVAAHNDFAPWNIRVESGVARIFDWEYAEHEQLPLFDPLHFVMAPMALRRRPATNIARGMLETLQLCPHWLGEESCKEAETQALTYLINVCTLYLWSNRGASEAHPVLDSYSKVIDFICLK